MKLRALSLILFVLPAFEGCHPRIPPTPTEGVLEPYEERVVRVRQLPFKEPVSTGTKSRSEIQAYVESRIKEEYGPGELAFEGETLELLGLVPKGFPYQRCLVSFLRDQVEGYYDPRAKELYLAEGTKIAEKEAVLVHELTHALQDQHFDLNRLISRNRSNDDRTSAINALIEGDATFVMIDELSRSRRTGSPVVNPKATCEIPPALSQSFLFPYLYGIRFVQELRANQGWAGVNLAYTELPYSTEQILHPEKYLLKNDPPIDVPHSLPVGRLPGGWTVLNDNVLGEWGWQIVFSASVGNGWGGDRYWLLKKPDDSRALLMASVWDTEFDSREAERAWSERFASPASGVLRRGRWLIASIGADREFNNEAALGEWLPKSK